MPAAARRPNCASKRAWRDDNRLTRLLKATRLTVSGACIEGINGLLHARVAAKAMLITRQLAVKAWHAWLDGPTVADAILGRIVHGAHRMALKGASPRKPEGQDRGEAP